MPENLKSNKKQSSVLVEWKLISVGEDDSVATGKNANNGGKKLPLIWHLGWYDQTQNGSL
jgi:hypothetical protein